MAGLGGFFFGNKFPCILPDMCSSLSLEVNDNLSVINMMLIEFKLIERSLTFPCYTLPKVGGCLFSCETYLFVSWRLLVNLSRVDMKNGLISHNY